MCVCGKLAVSEFLSSWERHIQSKARRGFCGLGELSAKVVFLSLSSMSVWTVSDFQFLGSMTCQERGPNHSSPTEVEGAFR